MTTVADILGLNRKPRIHPQWKEHYQQLNNMLEQLQARNHSLQEGAQVKIDDLTEAGSEEIDRVMECVATSSTKELMAEIREAIQRIERNRYGICELTGAPIEQERLKAIPWARYSFAGQQELEKGSIRRGIPRLRGLDLEVTAADTERDEDESENEKE